MFPRSLDVVSILASAGRRSYATGSTASPAVANRDSARVRVVLGAHETDVSEPEATGSGPTDHRLCGVALVLDVDRYCRRGTSHATRRSAYTSIGGGAQVQSERAHLAIQRRSGDAERFRRPVLVALRVFQRLQNGPCLGMLEASERSA